MNAPLVLAVSVSHSLRRKLFAVPAIAFLLTCSALAQQTLGALNGTVTDTTGAIVQGTSYQSP